MHAVGCRIPVVMIVFNRPDTTSRVFGAVSGARPRRLLIVADGPRRSNPADIERCAAVRAIVQKIDWPCELSVNFADGNLGCQERVVSGLDWVFSLVEEAIILEDDCLPDPTFFVFCGEMLARYRGDSRVAAICGTNLLERYSPRSTSYHFSRLGGIWGWATWATEWKRYDRYLESWPENRRGRMLHEIFDDARAAAYWTRIFDSMHEDAGTSIWDYQWFYTRLVNNSLSVVPNVNLVTNIGFGADSTHTARPDPRLVKPARAMDFPLKHPSNMIPLKGMDRRLQQVQNLPLHARLTRKLMSLVVE